MGEELQVLIKDTTPIKQLQSTTGNVDGDSCIWWRVFYREQLRRYGNCDRITAYPENGQGAPVPWFAVWLDGSVIARVDAMGLEVQYVTATNAT